jgi:hypothetical protein
MWLAGSKGLVKQQRNLFYQGRQTSAAADAKGQQELLKTLEMRNVVSMNEMPPYITCHSPRAKKMPRLA